MTDKALDSRAAGRLDVVVVSEAEADVVARIRAPTALLQNRSGLSS